VEVFHAGKRVASHARNHHAYHTTVSAHMPKSHQAQLEWTSSRLIHWAEGIGPATAEVVRTIMERKPHPEMGYRACLGILRLENSTPDPGWRPPASEPSNSRPARIKGLKSILKRALDRQLVLDAETAQPGPQHENLRGPHYYDPPTTLVQ